MWLLLALTARAEKPLPSYRDQLARERWHEVNTILEQGCAWQRLLSAMVCGEGVTDAAVAHADAFQRVVFRDAGLEYLAGLALRYDGDDAGARRRYESALALDPTRVEAWYDLGEIALKEGRLDRADEAFGRVAALESTGERAWIGPWRLAEVAATRHDAVGFERQIKVALERGFSFRSIQGLPNWQAFYADPALRDTLDKLLTVYADRETLDSLRNP